MGLLVGSGLVERLRREGGWGEGWEGERFALGWWEREGEGEEKGRWRYGIDIVPSTEPGTGKDANEDT
jgi:hypothetical protein